MADSKVPTTGLKATLPQIPNVDELKPNEKVWEYQRRVKQAQINKGSRYPPFSIQHMPWERQRLSTPMTDEDRFLRKQWLKDQNLSPNEPRYVPEARPMCRARRLVRLPWDTVERALTPLMGAVPANYVRVFVPKFFIAYAAALALFYHISYNPKSWESHHGFNVYGRRQPRIPGEDHSQFPPEQEVYSLRGFDRRTSHFNVRTSAQGQ